MTAAEKRRIAEQIRTAIDESNLTPSEIARRSGIDKSIISRFMSGKGGLTLESIEKLAPVLGLRIVGGKRLKKR